MNTKITKTAYTDTEGFFEFTDLDVDTYVITAKKRGYKKSRQRLALEDGEQRDDIEITLLRKTRRQGAWIIDTLNRKDDYLVYSEATDQMGKIRFNTIFLNRVMGSKRFLDGNSKNIGFKLSVRQLSYATKTPSHK